MEQARKGEGKGQEGYRSYWRDVKAGYAYIRARKQCRIVKQRGRFHLIAPMHIPSIGFYRGLGGQYRRRSTVWSFPLEVEGIIRKYLEETWGEAWEFIPPDV